MFKDNYTTLVIALIVTITAANKAFPSDTGVNNPKASRWHLSITGKHEVSIFYRQGLAHVKDGWIFSSNNGLFRTDEHYRQTSSLLPAIPSKLSVQGYNKINDVSVNGSYLWAPIERDDKNSGVQVIARYDTGSLKFIDSFTVPQHYCTFVAVDKDGTIYSTDSFTDDTILRYKLVNKRLKPLSSIKLSSKVTFIHGGDIADGALWLSTNDAHKGLYRADLSTGEVQDLGSVIHGDDEVDGVDATTLPGGLLYVLSIDANQRPVRVIDAKVSCFSK